MNQTKTLGFIVSQPDLLEAFEGSHINLTKQHPKKDFMLFKYYDIVISVSGISNNRLKCSCRY